MKDKYGKPDTCDKCIHYKLSDQLCDVTQDSPYAYETCPVPKQIQALKEERKDPNEEICSRYLAFCGTDKIMDGEKYRRLMELLDRYRPKDKPGDKEAVWEFINDDLKKHYGKGIVETDKKTVMDALRYGGF